MRDRIFLLTVLSLAACTSGDDERDTAVDTAPDETDTDTDTNEPSFTSLAGSLSFSSSIEGVAACDLTVDVSGTSEPMRFPEFDQWQFALATQITEDRSEACVLELYERVWSLLGGGEVGNLSLAYELDYSAGAEVRSLWVYGAQLTSVIAHTDFGETVTVDGANVSFAAEREVDVVIDEIDNSERFVKDCTDPAIANFNDDDLAKVEGGIEWTQPFACGANVADTLTLTITQPGEVTLSIDTHVRGQAFDPVLSLNDDDGCTVAVSDDNFVCTEGSADYALCPVVGPIDLEPGTYTVSVAVWSLGSESTCDGPLGTYAANVRAPEGTTLVSNDETYLVYEALTEPRSYTYSGSFTLQE